MSTTPDYLTKKQAAEICDVSEHTIRRYREQGRFSNHRYGANNVLEIPVTDLVSAGLLDPLAVTPELADHAARSRAESELVTARNDLAVAQERITALEARLADSREEIGWLRSLVARGEVA